MSPHPFVVRLCPWGMPTHEATIFFGNRPHLGETIIYDDVRYTITEIDWEQSDFTVGDEPAWFEFIIAREDTKPGLPKERMLNR
jgi:hypothetical protein